MTLFELPGDTLRRFIGSYVDVSNGTVTRLTEWPESTVYNLQTISVHKAPSDWRLSHFPYERFEELVTVFHVRLAPHTQIHADFQVAFLRQQYYHGFREEALKPGFVPPVPPMPTREQMQSELLQAGMAPSEPPGGASATKRPDLASLDLYLDQMEQLYGLIRRTIDQLRNALPPIMPDSGDMRAGTADDQRRIASVLMRRVALSVLAAHVGRQAD